MEFKSTKIDLSQYTTEELDKIEAELERRIKAKKKTDKKVK